MRREAATRLPTCEWRLPKGQLYSCFLSHFKVEAGAEARYLKDTLDTMLSCPAYLDSSTLADLRELFSAGVDKSEVRATPWPRPRGAWGCAHQPHSDDGLVV